ncbi:MAG: FixH family protein [Actinomycetota bacterium]|nr:FixH family protein [Actinomycetota bacterium]
MNAPIRLVAFAAVLGLAFAVAALAGATIGPIGTHTAAGGHVMSAQHDTAATGQTERMTMQHGAMPAGGLAVSQDGYTLEPAQTYFRAGKPATFAFRITYTRGRPVRAGYELESERELHLIVVRRDGLYYQHLHPTRDQSGTWSTQLTLPHAGVYRAFADFQIAGQHYTLGSDLFAPGDFEPQPLPAPQSTAATVGYTVTLHSSSPNAGGESELTFRVTRDGQLVAGLQPYLGANGHLVALREGDLAYLHVHPDAAKLAPGEIQFMAAFPTAGPYRLYLQFKSQGMVHTVAYTMQVP